MRTLLIILLLAMCVLCGVQWWRESELREKLTNKQWELLSVTTSRDQLNERVKAADAELLRLTGAVNDLRANSVAKTELEAANESANKLRTLLHTAAETVTKQNAAIQKANELLKKTAAERDELAKKAADTAEKYNALVKKQGGG